ncbi:MAG: hypothetical protein DRQ48_00285 [Gammaproteobacteria bacterium]|nr:MAG: hypothetical protein DRQ48_00285 [Gammaproteobacteria bacterium]
MRTYRTAVYHATGHGFAFNADALKYWTKVGDTIDIEFAETHDAEGCWVQAYDLTLNFSDSDANLNAAAVAEEVFRVTNSDPLWRVAADFYGAAPGCLNARSLSVGDVIEIHSPTGHSILMGVDTTGFRVLA